MRFGRLISFFFVPAALLSSAACSSITDAHSAKEEMMSHYMDGRYDQAREILDDKLRPSTWYNDSVVGTGDEIMWRLEAGSLCFLQEDYETGIAHFEAAEERMEDFDARAVVNLREVGAESAVLVTNLNALPYRGLCRDRNLMPVFKAFAYLGKKDEEGFRVELFRLREIQEKVLTDYQRFAEEEEKAVDRARKENKEAASGIDTDKIFTMTNNASLNKELKKTERVARRGYGSFINPFAIFLSAYGYAREGDFENALVDFERLRRILPRSRKLRSLHAYAMARAGRTLPGRTAGVKQPDFPFERNSVMVVFANGRSAALRQSSLYLPVIFRGYATLAAVAWPVCEYYEAPYSGMTVQSGGKEYTDEVYADLDGILAQEYRERLPGLIARTVLSTAVKEFGSYVATRAAAQADDLAGVAVGVTTSLYKMAMNTADTRSWEILPKEIRVAMAPVPDDRTVVISLSDSSSIKAVIPPDADSAIIYIHAPSRQSPPLCRIFPLHAH